MESPLVYESDDASPVADFYFIILTERLLIGGVILVLVFFVDGACDLERPVDALSLNLEALARNLVADVRPHIVVFLIHRGGKGISAHFDRPGMVNLAIVL